MKDPSRVNGHKVVKGYDHPESNKLRGPAFSESVLDDLIDADFIADTKLPTDIGHFRLRAYRLPGDSKVSKYSGKEPCVIYNPENPPFGSDGEVAQNVPIRVHDQCLTSEVFRSQR